MRVLLAFGLILYLCPSFSAGQRLSQGASDWYMRFHDFDMVKRHVDRPVTTRYHTTTVIKHRYAITEIATDIHNPATVKQTFQFGFAMPKDAFISNVTLFRAGNETGSGVHAEVSESDWLRRKEPEGKASDTNGHEQNASTPRPPPSQGLSRDKLDILFNNADFKQFVLPIQLGPGDNVTLVLVYELLLTRRHERYTHSVSISPGEAVKDFQIRLTIADSGPLKDVVISAPVIGEVTSDAVFVPGRRNVVGILFSMSEVEQMHYFGSHGFTGDFRATFDLELGPQDVDMVVQDNYFLHFYDIPKPMESMPKHVMFLLDTSDSMSGPKMDHAKEALRLLLTSLDDRDFLNLLLFNDTFTEWKPESAEQDLANDTEVPQPRAYPANVNITTELLEDVINITTSGPSNLTQALLGAIATDKAIWETGEMPENAYTLFIVFTDGRAHRNHTENKHIRRVIRQANKISRVPIFILGMGFDANLAFLENIAEKSGAVAKGVIEDLDVAPQIKGIQRILNDIVLKDIHLNFVGDAFDRDSLSRTSFKVFRQGGSVAVAGKWRPEVMSAEFEMEITGQSANGLYIENLPTIPFVESPVEACSGWVELCSEPRLQGDCIFVNMSRSNLHEYGFSNMAASLNISGDCAWLAYPDAYYQGGSVTLLPGSYDIIPLLQKDISSLKRMPLQLLEQMSATPSNRTEGEEPDYEDPADEKNRTMSVHRNSIERVWAFLMIQDVLVQLELRPDAVSLSQLEIAKQLALEYNFLTPFTELHFLDHGRAANGSVEEEEDLVEPSYDALLETTMIQYRDLNPVFLSLDDPDISRQWEALQSCQPPVQCEGNFHYEVFEEFPRRPPPEAVPAATKDAVDKEALQREEDDCLGSIALFTKANFEGESFNTTSSIHQLYHKVNSQRLRSIRVEDTCCWLLFDQRFFSGQVEKVCGDFEQPLRVTNIGSIKRIGPEMH